MESFWNFRARARNPFLRNCIFNAFSICKKRPYKKALALKRLKHLILRSSTTMLSMADKKNIDNDFSLSKKKIWWKEEKRREKTLSYYKSTKSTTTLLAKDNKLDNRTSLYAVLCQKLIPKILLLQWVMRKIWWKTKRHWSFETTLHVFLIFTFFVLCLQEMHQMLFSFKATKILIVLMWFFKGGRPFLMSTILKPLINEDPVKGKVWCQQIRFNCRLFLFLWCCKPVSTFRYNEPRGEMKSSIYREFVRI